MNPRRDNRLNQLWLAGVIFAFAFGIAVRVYPSAGFTGVGFDENLYRKYVTMLSHVGLTRYPEIVETYIAYQETLTGSILPPMRFLYIGTSALWHTISGVEVLRALHQVACAFSILTLGVSFGFALRLAGKGAALAVLALMSCAPLQIHMSQHALVDGFFAFWALLALWLLWENLRAPHDPRRLLAFGLVLALMVTTKENSFFVFTAICGILVMNRWIGFGTITRPLLLVLLAGPLLGFTCLVLLAGGLDPLVQTYQLSVSKNFFLTYAIKTGDGPWYRYLSDLFLASPLILILALAEVFQLRADRKPLLFVTLFVGFSYLIMCNLKYGMNLRYANMWDMPLRLLAFGQVCTLASRWERRRELIIVLLVVALCAFDLRQYYILAVENPLYELVPEGLLRALKILK
jgi:4-amino-4-deoxy-L-arabinose transferase-like glycosyltransferase